MKWHFQIIADADFNTYVVRGIECEHAKGKERAQLLCHQFNIAFVIVLWHEEHEHAAITLMNRWLL